MKTTSQDELLQIAVTAQLDWDSQVDATHIGVSAKEAAAAKAVERVEGGEVAATYQREVAERAVRNLLGVRDVENDITVTKGAPT